MNAERWQRVQDHFHQIADLEPSLRARELERLCADDPSLIPEVMSLVEGDQLADVVIDKNLAETARDLLDQPGGELPREKFGPYRITGILGEGGMGVVYRGVRDDLDSVVAIKVLRDAALSPARRDRFALEQRTLARLNHPAIATLHDADVLQSGIPWFAMEYVEGEPLTTWCNNRNSSLRERLQLFRSVCQAVQHAHAHLIIHRDLKPSNILVRDDGQVKLLDFGIAKPLDRQDDALVTRTGLRFMTPAYAAPEQFRDEPVGTHTDIYALGVVLYELLAGKLPFDLSERTPGAAELIITSEEPQKPSLAAASRDERQRPAVSRGQWSDLDVLCMTAMHKDPQRRYATANALIRDIDHFLASEPLEARPDALGYRIDRFVRRHRRGVLSTTVALLLIVGLSAFYTVGLARARNTAVAQAERAQRIQKLLVSLFEGGDDAVGPADSLRVITLVDRGVQEAHSLNAEPVVQAELYETLGTVLQKLGSLERADSLLTASLDQRRRIFGNDNANVALSLVALGSLRAEQASLDTAEMLIREGLAMSQRHLASEHPQVGAANDALGHVLELRGKYDEAIAVYTEAVANRGAVGTLTPELGASITGLANNHFYLGNYAAAESLSRAALQVSRQVYGAEHPHVAEDLINIGAVKFEQGDYKEAERLYREALVITTKWYGPNHYVTASGLTMLGRALRTQERWAEADSALSGALAIQEGIFGPTHPRVASPLNDLASISLSRQQYDLAARQYERVVDIYKKAYNGQHYYIGIALANLASVWMAEGDNARAERGFREAIAMYDRTLPAGHLTPAITRIKLGRALLRQGKFAEAARESAEGYDVVSSQASPTVSWLQNARSDLVAAYDSLGTPEKGARYRAELSDSNTVAKPR